MMHMQTASKLHVLKYKSHAVIRVQCVYASKANKMEILQTQIFLTDLSVETAGENAKHFRNSRTTL